MQVRYTAVPAEADGEPGAAAPVDEAWMRRLEQVGYERARGPAPWDEVTPPNPRPRPR
jgi:hypothetical protein